MKKVTKRISTVLLATIMVLAGVFFLPQNKSVVEAATPYFIHQSTNVTYQPDSYGSSWYTDLSISGCTKATSIKNLKSSNSSVVRVQAKPGFVRAYFHKKAGSATISCKVNGVSISTKLTVKKYVSPVASFKVGSKNFTGKFNGKVEYNWYHTSSEKNKTITVKAKSGWYIRSYYGSFNNVSKHESYYGTSLKSSISVKNCTLTGRSDYLTITFVNPSKSLGESIELTAHKE